MDNPQAFPLEFTEEVRNGIKRTGYQQGMTLRDYFAGQALVGHCANQHNEPNNDNYNLARESYRLADSMLKERKNEQPTS